LKTGYIIYPNPVKADERLMIVPENLTGESYLVLIYSSSGQKIKDYSINGFLSIPIDNSLAKGIYYIIASSDEYTQTDKLVIE